MVYDQHTRGPLEVRLDGTASGAWAEIGYWCGAADERQWHMLAQTAATHVEATDARGRPIKGDVGTINEQPARFVPTEESAEIIANARLWSVASKVLEALKTCELALTMANHPACKVDTVAAIRVAREVIAEATNLTNEGMECTTTS